MNTAPARPRASLLRLFRFGCCEGLNEPVTNIALELLQDGLPLPPRYRCLEGPGKRALGSAPALLQVDLQECGRIWAGGEDGRG